MVVAHFSGPRVKPWKVPGLELNAWQPSCSLSRLFGRENLWVAGFCGLLSNRNALHLTIGSNKKHVADKSDMAQTFAAQDKVRSRKLTRSVAKAQDPFAIFAPAVTGWDILTSLRPSNAHYAFEIARCLRFANAKWTTLGALWSPCGHSTWLPSCPPCSAGRYLRPMLLRLCHQHRPSRTIKVPTRLPERNQLLIDSEANGFSLTLRL